MRWQWLVGGLIGVALVAVVIWYWTDARVERRAQPKVQDQSTASSSVEWTFTGSEWQAVGVAPNCPDPVVLASPVELATVTSILYPGQERGGQFKPHGGFRFADGANARVAVTAPLAAQLVRGSRYIEQGETQYLLEFVSSCGIMYRFDHLLTLAPAMQAAAEQFPAPQVDDSRTTNVSPTIAVEVGDTLGTAVGFAKTGNASLDFGLYDLRQKNGVTGLPTDDEQLAPYAACWFDWLSASDEASVRRLPAADATAGSTSQYCQ